MPQAADLRPVLLIATFNAGKIAEIRHLLSEMADRFRLESPADRGIRTPFVERGDTFLENAADKAVFYSKLAPTAQILAEDSGLEVEALGGEPGVFSARYAGEPTDDNANIVKLLKRLAGRARRTARFVCVVSLAENGRLQKSFRGEVAGEILTERRGEAGFGYDPVFFYPENGKTFAQLEAGEKNRISHRARAFAKLREYLRSL